MKKYQFTITAIIPLSDGGNKEVAKFEFYAQDKETAEAIKESLIEAYYSSGKFRPNPRNESDITEFFEEI